MTKATPIENPTAAIAAVATGAAPVAKADGLTRITDANGRSIAISDEIGVLDEMRLLKILGGENGSYLYFCSQLARVAEIGGEKVSLPNSDREFQALAVRLGRPGVNAVIKHFMATEESAVDTTGDAERNAVKK